MYEETAYTYGVKHSGRKTHTQVGNYLCQRGWKTEDTCHDDTCTHTSMEFRNER